MKIIDRVKSPSPKWAKRIGQGLMAVSALLVAYEFFMGSDFWMNIAAGSGAIGAFIMALFKE
jgi:hypothetical protein